ncbi:flagellar biosynthetic protein FliR [Demequina sp. TTPB684]|nr:MULTISPECIES: flagellar biosynthetic protein FliR [unclassified Demequina]MCB2412895.1 flagellar biosynthetic protein FliR [Demequina sp. TTPB684]UPU89754.1 flagellar biosynthetic protein FliR [Demequina sp. TMPB413]
MLASVRILAFLVVAPPFHFRAFPAPVKVAISLGVGLLAGPRAVEAAGTVPGAMLVSGSLEFLGALVLQLVVGLGLGFLVRMVFAAVQSAGSIIDIFGGFQLAQGFDPLSQTQGGLFSKFYDFSALALLFASNGHQLVLGGLVRSFDALPLGEGLNMTVMGRVLTGGLSELMVSALQIAGPLIVVLFLADVGLGLLTRAAPALNAFALGFPLKILLTLSLGSIAYLTLPQIVGELTERAVELVMGVSS